MLLTPRLSLYLFQIGRMLHKKTYIPALMKCPQCGISASEFTAEQADRHVSIRQTISSKNGPSKGFYYVVVGCEGYWTVDPLKLGLSRGNWEPVWAVIKKNLEYYIKEAKQYTPDPFEEVTEENKAEIAAVINRDGRLNPGDKANLLKQLDD